jgi:hypothetical protein
LTVRFLYPKFYVHNRIFKILEHKIYNITISSIQLFQSINLSKSHFFKLFKFQFMKLMSNIQLLKFYMLLFLFFVGIAAYAQCPSPAATTAAITSNSNIGAYTTSIGSNSVTYVTGNVVLGTSSNARTLTISLNTTVVVTAGSHLTVTNLGVNGKLIIQAGATVSVVGLSGANGNLGVNLGGIIEMCENTGIENCGTTTFTPNPSIAYVGSAGGKAVVKTINKSGLVGSLVMPLSAPGLTTSSNVTVATPATNISFPTPGGSYGSALPCTIGSNCTSLPFPVTSSCGEFATACAAGTTAPALTATTKSNDCPTTTVDLTTLTVTNTPNGAVLEWHSATPATSGNVVATPNAVSAATYYAVFYDAVNNCYSNVSGTTGATAVTATSNACTVLVGCSNLLNNPSFESPVVTNLNANNIQTGTSIPGWTASNNSFANPFNIQRVNGSIFAAGPDKADDGSQYIDIVGSAVVTQDFVVPAGGAYIKYSGSYANRDASAPTFYKPSYNYITILNSSGVIVGTSNAIDLIASLTDEKWLRVSGFTGTKLPAGTYTYKVVIGDYTHFDNAFVCLQANPPGGTIDCSKTQVSSAPVVGIAGQKTLSVTINVTTAGCISPLSVTGSGMSLPDGVTQVCTNSTGIQTFNIPVDYDGSALGTMDFTIGAAGSCSADLTKAPKKAACDIFTLECVPTVAPSLK